MPATIAANGAFRFDYVYEHLQISPLERTVGRPVGTTGWIRSVWLPDDRPGLMEFSGIPGGLHLTVHGVTDAMAPELQNLAQRMFSLDRDWAAFVSGTASDSILAAALARWPGLRPVVPSDPFETMCWGITSQHIGMAGGARLRNRLIAELGSTLAYNGSPFPLHPRAVDIAEAGVGRLVVMGYPESKAKYLCGVAEAIATGRLNLHALRDADPAEAEAELRKWKGIGPWTARFVLVRGIGHKDVLPVGENRLCGSLVPFYGPQAADEEQVHRLAEKWAGWKGWVAFFWRNIGHISGKVKCNCG